MEPVHGEILRTNQNDYRDKIDNQGQQPPVRRSELEILLGCVMIDSSGQASVCLGEVLDEIESDDSQWLERTGRYAHSSSTATGRFTSAEDVFDHIPDEEGEWDFDEEW